MLREHEIQLEESGVAYHLRWKFSGKRRKPGGRGEYDGLIAGFIVAIVQGLLAGLRDDLRASVVEAHYRGHVEDVLIETGEEKCAVVTDWAAEGESELLLLGMRFEIEEGLRCSEGAVAKEIEVGSVELVRSRFCDHVDHRASGSSQVGPVGV